jgi:hypothetical protein
VDDNPCLPVGRYSKLNLPPKNGMFYPAELVGKKSLLNFTINCGGKHLPAGRQGFEPLTLPPKSGMLYPAELVDKKSLLDFTINCGG